MNWYFNNFSCHLCTTWGTLASDSKIFCRPLQAESILKFSTHKRFQTFPMAHLTEDPSTKKLYIEFYSGDTVYIKMKKIGCRHIPTIYLSNAQFSPAFYCSYNFLASTDSSYCISTTNITHLDRYIFI